nr:hypothetical protein [Mesorhizobium sp. LNJC405B00]
MQEVDVFKAIANERRLQILDWLKDPQAHFPAQADGDLVEDGVCALLIAEKLGITQATLSSSDVCSSDLKDAHPEPAVAQPALRLLFQPVGHRIQADQLVIGLAPAHDVETVAVDQNLRHK